ncbi:unnamed protein product [Miscanthus lutarioriparius]|uniref:Uncharacterized protein n=1 Tax=Miscanthus lutarioriparius TaxID=422564 RepID=A0A811SKM9_9POAL|nr:unnamed protein product [Miscanthus lutarioriparius]
MPQAVIRVVASHPRVPSRGCSHLDAIPLPRHLWPRCRGARGSFYTTLTPVLPNPQRPSTLRRPSRPSAPSPHSHTGLPSSLRKIDSLEVMVPDVALRASNAYKASGPQDDEGCPAYDLLMVDDLGDSQGAKNKTSDGYYGFHLSLLPWMYPTNIAGGTLVLAIFSAKI